MTEAQATMNNAMLADGRFATTGRVDEDFFRQNVKYLLSRRYMVQLWTLRAVGLAGFAVLAVVLQQALPLVLGAAWLALSFFLQGRRLCRMARLNARRLGETVPDGVVMMTTSFHEDGVHSHNETTGGKVVMPYEHIVRLKETEEHLLLFSRADQYEVVFKHQLEEKDVQQLKAYLAGKCQGLKIK